MALEIISFLDANSGGLHAIDMISPRTNMHQYYVQADGIPQYIIMLEDAKRRRRGPACPLPISNRHDGLGGGPGGAAFSP